MGARDNEYIAPDYEDQLIAYTEMIGGGETSTVEFTVPETAGDYDFICTFPGHYQGGMVGILRVK
jgi:azurin